MDNFVAAVKALLTLIQVTGCAMLWPTPRSKFNSKKMGGAHKPLRPRKIFAVSALAMNVMVAAVPADATDALTGLGNFPFGVGSGASSVNGDGTVVVGGGRTGLPGNSQAFRWTQASGMVGLGYLPGDTDSSANAVNRDGSVVVGDSGNSTGGQAFRWTQVGGMVGLGDLAGGSFNSTAYGVSGDGAVVVGYGSRASGREAFRWAQYSGMVGLGFLSGGSLESSAIGVNNDGSVVVGWSSRASGSEAFRWTQAGGMVGLGYLPGCCVSSGPFASAGSIAFAVNGDGSVAVGSSDSASGIQAFRWTQTGGMAGLGVLPGGYSSSAAYSVNSDGTVVVGVSWQACCGSDGFRWTQTGGMQSLTDWLSAAGVSLAGWAKLGWVTGVSADGSVVVGQGKRDNGMGEAFIARVGPANGIVGLTDLRNSLASTVMAHVQLEGLNSLTLNGAHHRPLMDIAMSDGSQCGWASGNVGRFNRNKDGWTGLAEIGACHDFADQGLRAGIGVGESQASQDQGFNGHSKLRGEYVLGELDWVIPYTSAIVSALGMYGRWDADLRRGYSAGTSVSNGNTDLASWSLRARLDWRNAFSLGNVGFTPSLQFIATHTTVDGYQETDGTAPARFDSQGHTAKESRFGLSGVYPLSDVTTLIGRLEWAHRFDSKGASVSGTADVLAVVTMPFTFDGNKIRQNWGRIGADIDYRLDNRNLISVSGNIASAGQDADFSAGVSWRYFF